MHARTAAIVLAAGQGTRMRSDLPKVLHPCAGEPLIVRAVRWALADDCAQVAVVVPAEGRRIRDILAATFPEAPLVFVVQDPPRGTGDAARVGLAALDVEADQVLILCGDVPLLQPHTRAELVAAKKSLPLALLTAHADDPSGYGRVIRDAERPVRIVEHRDADAATLAVQEINAGVYLCDRPLLESTLAGLNADNAQGELYLTDIVSAAQGNAAAVTVAMEEVQGVNTRADLARAEAVLRRRTVEAHMLAGVTFEDPTSAWVDDDVRLAPDVFIGVGVQLRGAVQVKRGACIQGPAVVLDTTLEAGARVLPFSHLEGAQVGEGATVGPFARLRPGTVLEAQAKVGNFVETKKAHLGPGVKASHLSYLGDTTIGAEANIGAGTITCNYDGQNKSKTTVGAGVFVGSNSTLVAPVDIGARAYIAAGSTINRPVPADALAFGRTRQVTREGYATRLREQQADRKKERK